MQLTHIIVYLIFNCVNFCQPDHLHGLKISRSPLARWPYDELNQDQQDEDYNNIGLVSDHEIEEIAEAIINEAKKRLKKRGLPKKILHLNERSDKSSADNSEEKDFSKREEGLHDGKSTILPFVKNDYVVVSHRDNFQVANVKINNNVDQLGIPSDNEQLQSKVVFKQVNASSNPSPKASYVQRVVTTNKINTSNVDKLSFIGIVVACCVAAVAGVGLITFCWYRLRTETKDIQRGKGSLHDEKTSQKKMTDEEKLVHGAEVYHYLHAKKQLQQIEEPNVTSAQRSINDSSDDDDEEINEDTVYECPGLAPPGDMKVVNPLFSDTESHYSDPPSYQSTPTPPPEEK